MNRSLLILTFAANFIGRVIYEVSGGVNDQAYFKGDAIAWAIIAFYILRKLRHQSEFDIIELELAKGLALLIVSNYLDEQIFDPTRFGWNEVALLVIIVLRICYVVRMDKKVYYNR